MLSIKEGFYSFFFPEKKIEDNIEKIFFYYDIYTSNFSRIYSISFVLIIGLSGILVFDFIRFWKNELEGPAKELASTHLVFLITNLFFIFSSIYIKRKVQNLTIYRLYIWLVASLLFLNLIWVSLIDQKINGQITVMIMGFFGISILLYIIPLDAIILYVSSTIIFLLLLPYYQTNQNIVISHYINIPILSLLSFFISNFFYRIKVSDFIKNQKIQKSTAEFDELIKKILPESISFRLRKEGKITPIIKEATVVFVDFVSFSKITKSTNIQKILGILEELFGEFDKILIQYNLEKIKTMGDGYMYAGGLFSNQTQLKEAIDSAIGIQNLLEKKREELISLTDFPWEVRIGIDCGNVIAGVIGNWRFSFDIWGDTVNIASRLVTECEPGKINISRNVFDRIWFYNEYQLEPRGVLPIKNLGTIEMFYLYPSKKSIEK